ncbi:ABC transporter substrate-binding protein [Ensifer adhaerens]|uniref:ABC transporter substrate-binding protein n=1 Tax=Ensifer adhaerens TaxID=106592 RepID=UPI001CBCB3FF|nr:ABC transporter substrate-binding protein [Ensifer adhaerens]MBZ7924230.1 ABC transporter substrate-binding protein [Ensifer adhaerens]UAX96516.1 ABC transporter substrate-binding protein [Ensifer adhaerens]UAY04140.1 ABC transporter substrate-binding protein [Ensifer adhaerens]UAY12126.1 ABC transporter substrate-binding protein [Ensifer adhaerens]
MNFNRMITLATCVLVAAAVPFSQSVAEEASPIPIGAVSTLTGSFSFPEATAAAQAVFDRVNENGGVGGRMIQYTVEDDRMDPSSAAQAARRLVDDEGVYANVASASLLECTANAGFYESRGVYSLQGTGVDPACFNTPNISPVNTGPYTGLVVSLYYAAEILGFDKVCSFATGNPVQQPGWEAAIARYNRVSKKPLLVDERNVGNTDDMTQFVLKAKGAGCQAAVFVGIEPQVVSWMQSVAAQNIQGITWIFLTPAYTLKVAEVLGETGEGIYANSEFEPFLSKSPALEDWQKLMTERDIPVTSFSQGGYLAATIFVDVLKSINGEITRESVSDALRKLDRYETPLIGTPYSVGEKTEHASNSSSKFVKLGNGAWEVATPEFVVLPN